MTEQDANLYELSVIISRILIKVDDETYRLIKQDLLELMDRATDIVSERGKRDEERRMTNERRIYRRSM